MEEGELVLVVGNKSNHLFDIDDFATIEVAAHQHMNPDGTYLISQNGGTAWVSPEDIASIKDSMVSKNKILKLMESFQADDYNNRQPASATDLMDIIRHFLS